MKDKSSERNARLEAEIRTVLTELLQLAVKDPRLTDVTVSRVRLSADRSQARVYFSVFGDDERVRQAADGFAAAQPFLRLKLGQRMRLRVVPELHFERDTSYEYGDRMERLFDRLHREGAISDDAPSPSPEDED